MTTQTLPGPGETGPTPPARYMTSQDAEGNSLDHDIPAKCADCGRPIWYDEAGPRDWHHAITPARGCFLIPAEDIPEALDHPAAANWIDARAQDDEVNDGIREALERAVAALANDPDAAAVVQSILDQRGCEEVMEGEYFEDGRLTSLIAMVIYG